MKMFASLLAATIACTVAIDAQCGENTRSSSADLGDRGLQPSDFPRWKKLAPGIFFYEGLHAPDPDGRIINTGSLIVVTPAGVVVVDGQGDAAQSRAMVDTIAKITPQPIKYVIVCSDHGDHTNGNPAIKAAFPDVVFVASPASQKALSSSPVPPSETVSDKRVLRLGGTELDILNLGRAHTGGDLVVYLPKTKILFMSEVYMRGVFPAMRTAYPREWVKTIEKAQAMDVSWYIPAHGFVDAPSQMKHGLEDLRQAIVYLIGEGRRLHEAGITCDAENAAPGEHGVPCEAAQKAHWGPTAGMPLHGSQQPVAMARIYQELDGKLP